MEFSIRPLLQNMLYGEHSPYNMFCRDMRYGECSRRTSTTLLVLVAHWWQKNKYTITCCTCTLMAEEQGQHYLFLCHQRTGWLWKSSITPFPESMLYSEMPVFATVISLRYVLPLPLEGELVVLILYETHFAQRFAHMEMPPTIFVLIIAIRGWFGRGNPL